MKETEILVEQQPPQGVLFCDHAGLVINKFSNLVGVEEGDASRGGGRRVALEPLIKIGHSPLEPLTGKIGRERPPPFSGEDAPPASVEGVCGGGVG